MIFSEIDRFIDTLNKLKDKNLYIVGAGRCGEILGNYFNKKGIEWNGYIDKRSSLSEVNGKRVDTYEHLDPDACYVVSSFYYREDIIKELENKGILQEQIVVYENQNIFFEIYNDLVNWKKLLEKTRKFSGKYSGKRCFIIGNGPSLKVEDLEKLQGDITFASNSIYALYSRTKWRPTFYCAWDSVFCKEMMSERKNLQRLLGGCGVMFTSILGEGIKYRDDPEMQRMYYMKSMSGQSDTELPLFSDDCCRQVYTSGSITYGMLQLAVYMGVEQIYLLGMDFNYSVERHDDDTVIKKNILNHMPEIEAEEKRFYRAALERYDNTYVAEIDRQLAGYQAAKKYADERGIRICNATRGGKLEVFPRVDFDSLFDAQ